MKQQEDGGTKEHNGDMQNTIFEFGSLIFTRFYS